MSKAQLKAKKRSDSLNPRQLRAEGKLPATIYGKGIESVSIELDTKEFYSVYKKDKTAIFELKVDKNTYSTVVKRVQMKPQTDNLLNVEFQNITAGAKVKMTVPVEIIGISPAVKAGGELIVTMTEMEIECDPSAIPHSIDVDISKLENFEDSLTVAQLSYPEGVKSLASTEAYVVKVATPKTEEQLEAEEAKHAEMPVMEEPAKEE